MIYRSKLRKQGRLRVNRVIRCLSEPPCEVPRHSLLVSVGVLLFVHC